MTVDHLGVPTKIMWQVCFQDFPRYAVLRYLEGEVLGHGYSNSLLPSGVRDEAKDTGLTRRVHARIPPGRLIASGKKRDEVNSWGTLF
jgi:hypothetical protein